MKTKKDGLKCLLAVELFNPSNPNPQSHKTFNKTLNEKKMTDFLFKIGILKLRLSIFLESGQVVIINCRSFETTKMSNSKGNRELSINGAKEKWTIDVDKIVAITAKQVWF